MNTSSLICGDSLDIMRSFPDGHFDLIVTSPPYNIRNSTGGGFNTDSGRWKNAALIEGYLDHSDDMPHDDYVLWQRQCLTEMLRLIPDTGAVFYNHKWRVQNGLLQDRHDIVDGFPVRQIIIWWRKGGLNFNDGYFLPTYEVIYLITKPQFRLKPKANAKKDVWVVPPERNNSHPAPFPVKIPEMCISSVDCYNVLDPFVGSGSTGVAAKMLGVDFVGIDISHEYCRLSKLRIDGQESFSSHRDNLESGSQMTIEDLF